MPKEDFTVARLSRGGVTFEVLVDSDKALRRRLGEEVPLSKVLLYDAVYRDARKGTRASEEELKKNFGTLDAMEIALQILTEGDIQITSEQRRKLIQQKRKQIIDFISKNSMDPRTNAPHPPARIENAMEEIDFSIDPFKEAKEQAKEVVEKLRAVLPLKVGLTRLAIRIPGEYVGKAYGLIKSHGNLTQEEWQKDGSWICVAEVPTGTHLDLMDRLNSLCSGRVEMKMLT